MKKLAFLIATSLISSAAFAVGVNLSQTPQVPIVYTADVTLQGSNGPETIPAPWFKAQIEITTDQLITVTGIQGDVTTADGQSHASFAFNFPSPIEILANSNYQSEMAYVGGLPQQNGTVYSVNIQLVGWTGSNASPGPALNTTATFVTQ